MKRHCALEAMVSKHAPNWRKESDSWKRTSVLHLICQDLDAASASDQSHLFDIPARWRTGVTKSLRGMKVGGWQAALQMGYRKLVIDQIAASLRMVLKRDTLMPRLSRPQCYIVPRG
jgi:hypothetical protein